MARPRKARPRKDRRARLLGIGGLVLALTACSTGTGTDPEPADEPLTIWADDDRAVAMRTFAEAYTRGSGTDIEVIVVEHDELRSSFVSTQASGLGPDILAGPHDWTGELVEAGAIAPVGLAAESNDTFTPGALEAVTYGGEVYGVPYATENLALLRNTDMVPDEPQTVEEMVTSGTDAVDSDSADRVLSVQVGEEGDAYHLHPFFTSAGGYLFGDDESGDPDPSDLGVASSESVAAFEVLAELGEDGSGVLTRDTDADNTAQLFSDGSAPFLITGPWSVAEIKQAGIPYEISPVPPFEDADPARPLIGVQSFFVASDATDPDLAEEFAQTFVSDPELSIILYDADPRVPALTAVLDVVAEDDPDLAEFERAGEEGLPMPAIPEMEEVWTPFSQAGADVIGGADPEEALADAEDEIIASFD